MKNGVIIINKEDGITSQGAVNRVKHLLGVKKAGHTGTLDPMATGVLPVLVGRGVKASEYMLTSDKHYIAKMLLCISTDTEDITGAVLEKCDTPPTESEVRLAVMSMLGKSLQTPPMYSALKVGGKKLCDLARDGVVIDRAQREITVHSISVKRLTDFEYELDVKCSKGTYIRTLCADIGKRLGVGAVMSALCRAEASGFTLADAVTLGELEGMSDEEREQRVLPIEDVFKNERRIRLSPFFVRLARSGLEIYLKKIGAEAEPNERVLLFDGDVFFALGEVREFDTGLAIKPIKQFDV